MKQESNWLAIAAGNSRLHWAWFKQDNLVTTWDTNHLTKQVEATQLPRLFLHSDLIEQNLVQIPICLASVVAAQTKYWQAYNYLTAIGLEDVWLTNVYPSLGIDRALAVSGAIAIYHQPCLVIDGGTALTFTGASKQRKLIGGAILPGLRSQLLSLSQKTSALPEVALPSSLPRRWALATDTAIASGVLYTAIAGIRSFVSDWLQQFPDGRIIFTGGDGEILAKFLLQQFPQLADKTTIEQNLIFHGLNMAYLRQNS